MIFLMWGPSFHFAVGSANTGIGIAVSAAVVMCTAVLGSQQVRAQEAWGADVSQGLQRPDRYKAGRREGGSRCIQKTVLHSFTSLRIY